MERRSLELTILSADDLTKVGFLSSKIQPYVVVSLQDSTSLYPPQRQTTPVDKTGNTNPRWNFPLNFTLNDAALQTNNVTLHLQLFSRRTILSDALIGQVHVPALELVSSSAATHVTYQIKRKTSGKPKGLVNFSYKLGDKFTLAPPPPPPRAEYPYPATAEPAPPYGIGTGYAYPAPMSGYGYGAPQQQQQVVRPDYGGRRNNGMGMGMGMGTGLLGGALAGVVVGELLSDMGNHDDGDYYDDDDGGFDDGGFDF